MSEPPCGRCGTQYPAEDDECPLCRHQTPHWTAEEVAELEASAEFDELFAIPALPCSEAVGRRVDAMGPPKSTAPGVPLRRSYPDGVS